MWKQREGEFSSASGLMASESLIQACLLSSYNSFSPHVNAMRQVRFSISILWAWNVGMERSRGLSLTNSKSGKHTSFLCVFQESIIFCCSSCINVVVQEPVKSLHGWRAYSSDWHRQDYKYRYAALKSQPASCDSGPSRGSATNPKTKMPKDESVS